MFTVEFRNCGEMSKIARNQPWFLLEGSPAGGNWDAPKWAGLRQAPPPGGAGFLLPQGDHALPQHPSSAELEFLASLNTRPPHPQPCNPRVRHSQVLSYVCSVTG
jgi:hypothetical protein